MNQHKIQQAERQRNLGAGDSALNNTSAEWVHNEAALAGFVDKTRGIVSSVTSLGTGIWRIVLSTSLPLGEYLAGSQNLGGSGGFHIDITDVDPLNKLVNTSDVSGNPVDLAAFVVWFSRAFSN
jgi:hypothetical protein